MEERNAVIKAIVETGLPVKVGDIEKITGLDRNTVQKIVNQLQLEGLLETDRCHNKIIQFRGE